jgi:hypothetical protein
MHEITFIKERHGALRILVGGFFEKTSLLSLVCDIDFKGLVVLFPNPPTTSWGTAWKGGVWK